VGIAGALLAGGFLMRREMMSAAGRALVAADPVVPADVIVVTVAAGGAGVLEASDLFHDGVAARVAVFADPPGAIEREFLRRGVPYEDDTARSIRRLNSLGVSSVDVIPAGFGAGTEAEGHVLPAWSEQKGFKSIVVVTTPDHSRRLRRVLHRAMAGRDTRVAIRPAKHSRFEPDRWWQDRGGIRIEIVELQKLFLDLARHPVS
jgi:hypothetical protein